MFPPPAQLVVGALTNIAGEMETQAEGLRSSGGDDTSSSEAPETTPFSDEEQQGVCDAFGHVGLSSLGPSWPLSLAY